MNRFRHNIVLVIKFDCTPQINDEVRTINFRIFSSACRTLSQALVFSSVNLLSATFSCTAPLRTTLNSYSCSFLQCPASIFPLGVPPTGNGFHVQVGWSVVREVVCSDIVGLLLKVVGQFVNEVKWFLVLRRGPNGT